ncbi:hypothetical protein N8D56_08075 [Devosia sp. A8/3-2]|nr:hypothetical protein N8D56_08075 [Devosia sp. A8/3-2]
MSSAVAKKLGIEPVQFLGDHMGFGPHAKAFAQSLRQAFDGR